MRRAMSFVTFLDVPYQSNIFRTDQWVIPVSFFKTILYAMSFCSINEYMKKVFLHFFFRIFGESV